MLISGSLTEKMKEQQLNIIMFFDQTNTHNADFPHKTNFNMYMNLGFEFQFASGK